MFGTGLAAKKISFLGQVSQRKKFRFWDRSRSEKNFVLGTGLAAKKISFLGQVSQRKKFRFGDTSQEKRKTLRRVYLWECPNVQAKTKLAFSQQFGLHLWQRLF